MPFEMSHEDWNTFLRLAPLIGSLVVAAVLGITLWKNSGNINRQTKLDLANFYHDFDVKLRDTDYALRVLEYSNDDQVYHNMIKIIITLTHIVDFKEQLKLEFDILYFEKWFEFGLGLACHLDEIRKVKVQGDQDYANKLLNWCLNQNPQIDPKPDRDLPPSVIVPKSQEEEEKKRTDSNK